MPRKNFKELRDEVMAQTGAAERVAAQRQELLVRIGLYELRQEQRVSQMDLATELGVTQSAVSKFEHRVDPRISTLRDYVAGLGGELEIRVRFDDREIVLDLVDQPEGLAETG
jgi:DNA-binding XRE family transcriptional regulator